MTFAVLHECSIHEDTMAIEEISHGASQNINT